MKFLNRKKKESVNRNYSEEKKFVLNTNATNTMVSAAAFAGGIVQITVDSPDPNKAFELWQKVKDDLVGSFKAKTPAS